MAQLIRRPGPTNAILTFCLLASALLELVIFSAYRGRGWPLGTEGLEALGAIAITLAAVGLLRFWVRRGRLPASIQPQSVTVGLLAGLLWTIEIGMNNILLPRLPERDVYDNIFWAIVALIILASAVHFSYQTRSIIVGVEAGIWSGFASGAVACLTALLVIVFGMPLLLHDPLNIAEWSGQGSISNTPTMATYFAYQTLAGAILHLVVLGLIMGGLLGLVGGIIGRGASTGKRSAGSSATRSPGSR